MWCYSQTVWRHYKNENTTQQVNAASLGVPAGLQWWSGRRYFTSCRVTRLFNVPSRCSLPPSPPLGSGSSRQHSASLQQWTQGLVRPPQRATEGSPSLSAAAAAHRSNFPSQHYAWLRLCAKAPPRRRFSGGNWWDCKERFKGFCFVFFLFLVEEIFLPSLLLMMVMISSGYPLLAV